MRAIRWGGSILAAAVLTLCSTAQLHATEIHWQAAPFSYLAEGKKLPDFLREFAASQGLVAIVDKDIDGTVSGNFNMPPARMLETISRSFGLVWYYDGRFIYFYPAGSVSTKIIKLTSAPPSRLVASLHALGIEDRRFPLTVDEKEGTVIATGPGRYVELVDQVAQLVDQRQNSVSNAEVRVFPLRYAWAQDRTLSNGEPIAGVVTVLKGVFGQQGGDGRASGRAGATPQQLKAIAQGRTVNSPVFGKMNVPPEMGDAFAAYDQAKHGNADGSGTSGASNDGGLPRFQSDSQINAVIVRDYAWRMDSYGKLIEALDVKPGQIEIEAKIIDVRVESLEALGVDWQLNSAHVNLSFSGRPQSSTSTTSGSSSGSTALGIASGNQLVDGAVPGALATTIIGGAAHSLLTSVNALAQDGNARVVSQPKVLTQDNVQATLSDNQTFYVRVAGSFSSDLYSVTAGTTLRVTPLSIVDQNGQRKVKLSIHVEDGELTSATVDQIPVIDNRNIDTEAMIDEGSSLLIGGLVYEQDSSVNSGIPFMSKIPVIGALFRQKNDNKVRLERLFLITPRLIDG